MPFRAIRTYARTVIFERGSMHGFRCKRKLSQGVSKSVAGVEENVEEVSEPCLG